MRRLLAIIPLLAVLEAPALACSREALRGATDAAFAAWRDRDQVAFRTAREDLGAALACQTEVVPRDLVRDVHVTAALSAYLPPRDPDAVVDAFRAALVADPGYALPEALAPAGNLLQDLLEQARDTGAAPVAEALGARPGCRILVDGAAADRRPVDRPSLLQEVCGEDAGSIALLPAAAALPLWARPALPAPAPAPAPAPSAAPAPDPVAPAPAPAPDRRGLRVGLAVGGGASLLAAGGLSLGARLAASTYEGQVADIAAGTLGAGQQDAVEATRARANGLAYGAQGAALLGAGLLTTALVVRF